MLVLALLTALSGCAAAPRTGVPDCAEAAFQFQPRQHPPLQVYVYRPAKALADAPVLMVLHGIGRQASAMCESWRDFADRTGQIVVAPRFDRAAYPGSKSYNQGGIRGGTDATLAQDSVYAVLEEIFDEVVRRERLEAGSYRLFGHSAGAQVAQRALLLGAVPRASEVIAANAGYYALPLRAVPWPYGIGGLGLAPGAECQAFSRRLKIELGERDNNPNHAALDRTPGAMAQGPHRLARGEHFLKAAQQRAGELGCEFNWTLTHVPDVAHDSAGMARAAAQRLP